MAVGNEVHKRSAPECNLSQFDPLFTLLHGLLLLPEEVKSAFPKFVKSEDFPSRQDDSMSFKVKSINLIDGRAPLWFSTSNGLLFNEQL